MIVSNGSGGVHIEGRVAELFAEYEIIGMAIMRVAIEDGSKKGEDMKTIIASLIIGLVLIAHYMLILGAIALSTASIFGKIMMGIMVTILLITTLNYLEELE